MTRENKVLIWILLFFLAVAWATYFIPFAPLFDAHIHQLVYLVMSFIPVLGAFYAFRLYGPESSQGKIFTWMILGFLSLFMGELLWTVYIFMGIDPFPSAADYFYILFYPLLCIALIKQVKATQVNWKIKNAFAKVLLITLVLILIGLVVYFGVYLPYDSKVSLLENGIVMAYGVGDLILILLTFFVLKVADEFKGGRFFSSWLALCAALFLNLLGDLGFAIYTQPYEEGVLWALRTMDLLWMTSFLIFAYGLFSLGNMVKEVQNRALQTKK